MCRVCSLLELVLESSGLMAVVIADEKLLSPLGASSVDDWNAVGRRTCATI